MTAVMSNRGGRVAVLLIEILDEQFVRAAERVTALQTVYRAVKMSLLFLIERFRSVAKHSSTFTKILYYKTKNKMSGDVVSGARLLSIILIHAM